MQFSWESSNLQWHGCAHYHRLAENQTTRTRQLSSDLKLQALTMLSRDPHRAQLAGWVGDTEIGDWDAGFARSPLKSGWKLRRVCMGGDTPQGWSGREQPGS